MRILFLAIALVAIQASAISARAEDSNSVPGEAALGGSEATEALPSLGGCSEEVNQASTPTEPLAETENNEGSGEQSNSSSGEACADSDSDGIDDCNESCPTDPEKIVPGQCGCGETEVDSDNDGNPDCADDCPEDWNKGFPGICGCGVSDSNVDENGAVICL